MEMDAELARQVQFAANEITRFRVVGEGEGQQGEIIFGPDIYPGKNIANPNSSLSLKAAVAHELTHFHRWIDKTELDGEPLRELDEALTSLEAVLRYERHLGEHDVRQLVAEAIQRVQMYVAGLPGA
jgi:hypothetical protein